MDLTQRQRRELAKYEALAKTTYGGVNHGKHAVGYVVNLQPATLLDLGCGRNKFVQMVREQLPACDARGVDWALPEADIVAPMYKVPLPARWADVITAFDSLEHLLPEDVDEVVREMRRLVRPGGRIVASITHRQAKQKLPDGSPGNLHPTVEDEAWWAKVLGRLGRVDRFRKPEMKRRVGDYWVVEVPPF